MALSLLMCSSQQRTRCPLPLCASGKPKKRKSVTASIPVLEQLPFLAIFWESAKNISPLSLLSKAVNKKEIKLASPAKRRASQPRTRHPRGCFPTCVRTIPCVTVGCERAFSPVCGSVITGAFGGRVLRVCVVSGVWGWGRSQQKIVSLCPVWPDSHHPVR